MGKRRAIVGWVTVILGAGLLVQRTVAAPAAGRPPIVGLAHIALFVSDIDKADQFYGHVLGYDHFSLKGPAGDVRLNYYKVNDHQYIEIYPGLKNDEQDRLSNLAFETTDVRQMRDYLASKGVQVPAKIEADPDKTLSFTVNDPEGRHIDFVQYTPDSMEARRDGKLLAATRVSDHMIHAGFVVHDRAVEDRFYKDILGFEVMWHGGMTENKTDWVDMRVPDGSDWLEYMLGVNNPSPKTRGVMNHLALGVKSIQPAYQEVLEHGGKPPQPPKIGRDGKWQLNLYDPDLTRVEFMEFKPSQTPCCSPMLSK